MKIGVAVCNSACLIALDGIGRLDILTDTFEIIGIPPEVRAELRLRPLRGIEVRDIANRNSILTFPIRVHPGEAAAIALCLETPGAEVILDDYQARRLAAMLGLRVIGTVGLILRAKREGLLDTVRPVLEALRNNKFYLAETLWTDALRMAGEA